MEALTEPPLESSTTVAPARSRPRANSSKSLGESEVTMPTALTQPVQFGSHATQPNCPRSPPHRARRRTLRLQQQVPSREDLATSRASNWFLPQAPSWE